MKSQGTIPLLCKDIITVKFIGPNLDLDLLLIIIILALHIQGFLNPDISFKRSYRGQRQIDRFDETIDYM